MAQGYNWMFFLTLALIGASVIDDFRSRKVHNSLVIGILVVSIVASLAQSGPSVYLQILASMAAAFVFCLPLYLLRALGGGDLKLLVALSPLMVWSEVGGTLLFSLLWGSILGVVMVLLNGELKTFATNLVGLVTRAKIDQQKMHKMPYTVAILFGFLTQVSLAQAGVSLL